MVKYYTVCFFEGYTEKLWGCHPKEISADWGAQRVKGLSIIAIIKDMLGKLLPSNNRQVETSLIEEFIYPKYGPGQLWETVAAEIEAMGGKILHHTKVTKLETRNQKVKAVICEDLNSQEEIKIHGDIFISSMPLKDLVAGMKEEAPQAIQHIAQGLHYRDFVTIGVLVNKLNMKNLTQIKTLNDIVPDCWIYVQDIGVKLGRIQIFNNWSPYMIKDVDHKVWIGLEYFCNEGDDFWNMTDEECTKFAIEELIKMGVINQKEDVEDTHREKVKKAYPAYFDTYSEIDQLIEWLNTFENLYCVGRNGQHRYNNMDHSMVTAMEAANNILTGKKSKQNIWQVNTEKTYHETNVIQKNKEVSING